MQKSFSGNIVLPIRDIDIQKSVHEFMIWFNTRK